MKIKDKIKALKYEAKIITQRSDDPCDQWNKEAIHWEIKINDKKICEYSEGIGHFIQSQWMRKVIAQHAIEHIKQGSQGLFRQGYNIKEIKSIYTDRVKFAKMSNGITIGKLEVLPPKIERILESMSSDADAVDYSFEEWCENMGYDSDSRKAEKIYNACRDSYAKLKSIGFDAEELREHFQREEEAA